MKMFLRIHVLALTNDVTKKQSLMISEHWLFNGSINAIKSQPVYFIIHLCFCWSFIVLHKAGVSCLVALAVLTTHTFAPGVKFSDVFQLLTRSHWSFLTCFNYSVSLVLSIQLLSIFLSWAELVWSGGISLIPFQIWNNWSTQNSF